MPEQLDVRLGPDGQVATRLASPDGPDYWFAVFFLNDVLNMQRYAEDEVASWPRLALKQGRADPPTVGAGVHYTPRDTGERASACVDATVAAVDDVEGSRWAGLDRLADGERADLDTGVQDADSPTCDGLRHAPGTWHWPATTA